MSSLFNHGQWWLCTKRNFVIDAIACLVCPVTVLFYVSEVIVTQWWTPGRQTLRRWKDSPSDEFDGRNGEKMSYQKYYAEKYNKSIRDPKQILIITIPKVLESQCSENLLLNLISSPVQIREQRSWNTGLIYLVPELCNMTGLSDEQRAHFKLIQDIGAFTSQENSRLSRSSLRGSTQTPRLARTWRPGTWHSERISSTCGQISLSLKLSSASRIKLPPTRWTTQTGQAASGTAVSSLSSSSISGL